MKTTNSARSAKPAFRQVGRSSTQRAKIIHISNLVHKKLKIFCATLEIDLGHTAEKAISDYITKNS
ncbi:MAG TPA: hypothetical protein PKD67_10580 [Ignavibacteriaceae bacterium]|nr:hypothetical protein [Ignavibacteriaceae bacterium]